MLSSSIQTINKMRNFIIIVIFAVLFNVLVEANSNLESDCGKLNTEYHENNEHNIKKTTELDEFPWMARIRFTSTKAEVDDIIKGECAAVLISKRHLLTTAHCHGIRDKVPISVILGDWDSKNSIKSADCQNDKKCAPIPQEYKIKSIITHPDYEITESKNDIAIIQLEEEVEFSDYIQPVCLPSSSTTSTSEYDGQKLINVGWTRRGNYKTKEVIQIISKTDCSNFYEKLFKNEMKLTESAICGGCLDNADLLSGAALMGTSSSKSGSQHYYLVGLVARGTQKCDLDHPLIFENIAYHHDWIKSIIN